MLRIKPMAGEWKAWMLPLCFAVALPSNFIFLYLKIGDNNTNELFVKLFFLSLWNISKPLNEKMLKFLQKKQQKRKLNSKVLTNFLSLAAFFRHNSRFNKKLEKFSAAAIPLN